MKVIQVPESRFNELFTHTLNQLKLRLLDDGTINATLNSQVDVDRYIQQLHRQFHYEVVQLQRKLEDA